MNGDALVAETNHLMDRLSGFQKEFSARNRDRRIDGDILLHLKETLERLEISALHLESSSEGEDALGEVRRALHTVKGDAGILGLSEMSELLHRVEDLLERFLAVQVCPADMLLKVKDWLMKLLTGSDSGGATGEVLAGNADGPGGIDQNSGKNIEPAAGRRSSKELKMLVVEDDLTSRLLLKEILKPLGPVQTAINGRGAVEAVRAALEKGEHYDLVCLDIMMPDLDGIAALKEIRAMEEAKGIMSSSGVKILMTTVLDDIKNISTAYSNLCDDYIVKPVGKEALLEKMHGLDLINTMKEIPI